MNNSGINTKWIGETITVYIGTCSFTGLFSEIRLDDNFITLDKGTPTETVISINFIEALRKGTK